MAEVLSKVDVSNDIDNVTALILYKMSQLGMKVVAGNGKEIIVTPDNFKCYLSMSLVYVGHYKAATTSDRVSKFLAKKITVIARSGCPPPKRLGNGLQLVLEKIIGIALINKL